MKMFSHNSILIVDDTPKNLKVLIEYLEEFGFSIRVAMNGEKAIEYAEKWAPTLILLDVLMPTLDGFETCKHLKDSDLAKEISVIFMTALTEITDKVKAFEVGAVDYVTKPLQKEEVLSRVTAHITICNQQKELKETVQKLAEANKELVRLNAEKNEFLGMVSHDLKNPLNHVSGCTFLLIEESEKKQISPFIVKKYTTIIKRAATQMLNLIENLLNVNEIESNEFKVFFNKFDFRVLLCNVLEQYDQEIKSKEIEIHYREPHELIYINADENACKQVLDNLISNALKFSYPGQNVYVELIKMESKIYCKVKDEGQGLTQEDIGKLFEKFARLSAKPTANEHSTGLGLSIVKKLMEAMNGRVWAKSKGRDKGTTFVIEFPVEASNTNGERNK